MSKNRQQNEKASHIWTQPKQKYNFIGEFHKFSRDHVRSAGKVRQTIKKGWALMYYSGWTRNKYKGIHSEFIIKAYKDW